MEKEEEGEKYLGRNIPSGCCTELKRSSSVSSALTADAFKDFSGLDVNASLGPSIAWTDEKHNSYIRSLEATFIDQLSHSISFCVSPLKTEWRPHSSNESPVECRSSSHQFTVLRNGRWLRINKRNGILSEGTGNSHFVGEASWIECSQIAGRTQCVKDLRIQNQHAPTSGGYIGRAIEVSDQNFMDEEAEETSNCIPMAKRLKTIEVDPVINDQVVPVRMTNTQDTLNVSHDAFERQQRVHPGFLLGNPE